MDDQMEITVPGGYVLRVIYEVTAGDLLIASALAALLLFMILDAIRKALWRR